MKKVTFLVGISVMALVFGMMVIGCGNGSTGNGSGNGGGGNTVPKTLVISGIPVETFTFEETGGVALFNVGTTIQQMQSYTGFAAGAMLSNTDINVVNIDGFITLTIPLRKADNDRWNGSGTFDIILVYDMDGGFSGTIYRKNSVNFSSEITSVYYNSFENVSQ